MKCITYDFPGIRDLSMQYILKDGVEWLGQDREFHPSFDSVPIKQEITFMVKVDLWQYELECAGVS